MASGGDIVNLARQYLGTQYAWGGSTPKGGFDCSGLVYYVYGQNGIQLPRNSYNQFMVGASVSPDKLRPGDLVFFDTDPSQKGPDHVGIYIGGGKFIHSPAPGKGVQISSLADSYYMNRWMGGRRISGVSASADPNALAGEVTPTLDVHELAETYGMSYSFFKSQPELYRKLQEAVSGQWSPDRFQAELKNTAWWKKNSDTVRQAQVLQKTDPATYNAQMQAARVEAQQLAVKAGAVLSSKGVETLAKNMVWYGWQDAQIQNYLGQYIKFQDKTVLGGMAGQVAQAIKQEAYKAGVAVTKQSVLNNAQYVVRGLTSLEQIIGNLREQSAGLYPAFADQIKAGANIQDLAQPYIQAVAQEMGVPETDVSVYSPKVKAALNKVDANGQPAPMSMTDFTQSLRDDPAWAQTQNAQDRTLAVGHQVLTDMGLVAR